ncbi:MULTISPECIES: S8 family peptidase [Actinosynnema]|uniref:S8 family peptidase n=1 Tax=Actinosynnema TaxID=40566 RepID=UPI0020A3111F|nr:S8 family peptidase [Actinosynnema pretiosum]MCP2095699.1 Peptidase inhibitor I9 [Actinosynnema pretiosum]
MLESRHHRYLAGVGTAALLMGVMATPASAATGEILSADAEQKVQNSFIVKLKDGYTAASSTEAVTAKLTSRFGGQVKHTYSSINGFAVSLSESAAKRLAADPSVEYVEQDQVFSIQATQTNPPSWGLDRIDQRNLPLNSSYSYTSTGSGVRAYVIDTGVRIAHNAFGGTAVNGYDAVDGDNVAQDGNGHGTHVAATVSSASYGVSKAAQIVAVRVLDNAGSGTTAGVVAGINWVTNNHVKPAVANMSLGGGASTSLDNAVASSISAGVTYAVAAGNSNANASNYSPARVASALTVGATTSTDARASYSNYGAVVDIFAPGSAITSAWNTSNTATNSISGTSMASPHVAGAAARYLSTAPTATPAQVATYLINQATTGKVTSPGTGSPNRLLYLAPTA